MAWYDFLLGPLLHGKPGLIDFGAVKKAVAPGKPADAPVGEDKERVATEAGQLPPGYRGFSTFGEPLQQEAFRKALEQLIPSFGQTNDFYSRLLSQDPEALKQFEAPFMRQFNEEIIPGLAERFAGTGSLSSSGFQQALGQAGAGLQENLAGLRGGLGLQAGPQILSALQQLISQPTLGVVPKNPSFLKQLGLNLIPGVVEGAAKAAPFFI